MTDKFMLQEQFLQQYFVTKEIGQLRCFIGIEVIRIKKGIVQSQRKYVLDLLQETGMLGVESITARESSLTLI